MQATTRSRISLLRLLERPNELQYNCARLLKRGLGGRHHQKYEDDCLARFAQVLAEMVPFMMIEISKMDGGVSIHFCVEASGLISRFFSSTSYKSSNTDDMSHYSQRKRCDRRLACSGSLRYSTRIGSAGQIACM